MRRPHPAAGPLPAAQAALPSASDAGYKRVCRLHGGKGGGPKGERNGAYRTGRYTEAKAEQQQVRMLIRGLRMRSRS